MRTRIAPAIIVILLSACSAASPAPKGWQASGTANDAWTRGDGAAQQQYGYSSASFSGSLQDLASQVTIDTLMRRGGRLHGSLPFAPCPGAAGVATFALPGGRVLEAGFAVHDGRAIRTSYTRPAAAPPDSNVTSAMQSVLC